MKYDEFIFSDEIDRWNCNENKSEEEECIDKNEVCDDEPQCENEEDEQDCPGVYTAT